MKLAEYIEVDRQLQLASENRGSNAARLLQRDRAIWRKLNARSGTGSDEDEALLSAWVSDVSGTREDSLGARLSGAVWWTSVLLAVFGLLSGVGAAAALLRYDGAQPINVLFFLGAIVGVQLLLLPLLTLSFLLYRRFRRSPGGGRGVGGELILRLLGFLIRLGVPPERSAKLRVDLVRIRAANSLFGRVQPLLALTLVQVFGVAFNVAVAGTLFFLVVFSDLTFSWGTTIQVEPSRIHNITSTLSLPWAGVFPQARPSLELVEATRFVRMEGTFAGGEPGAAMRAGGWWPFLLASTVTYGLLPRLLALGFGLFLFKKEMKSALARSVQVQALKDRLRTPLVTIDPDPVKEPVLNPVKRQERDQATALERGLELATIFWAYDEAPPEGTVARILAEAIEGKVAGRFQAGGIERPEGEVLGKIEEAVQRREIQGAAVFFEPFEPPKADARRFLTKLRQTVGASAPIVVLLAEFSGEVQLPVEEEHRKAWDQAIASIGDPFLLMSQKTVPS